MPTVYLPWGWPLLSGTAYDEVVYQGRIARRYVVSSDPRTNSQLFASKAFADLSQMRATAGELARASWKMRWGSHWASLLVSMARGDWNGLWTDAMNAWNALSGSEKQAWRDVAPHLATYNDPGEIFFGLAYVSWDADEVEDGQHWTEQPEPTGDPTDTVAWWQDNGGEFGFTARDGLQTEFVMDDPAFVQDGNWQLATNYEGQVFIAPGTLWTGVNLAYVEFTFHGRQLWFGYAVGPSEGTIYKNLDTYAHGSVDEHSSVQGATGAYSTYIPGSGEHVYKWTNIQVSGTQVNVSIVRVYYDWNVSEIVWSSHSWTMIQGAGTFGSWGELPDSDGAYCRFVVNGRYCVVHYAAGTEQGDVGVYVDGVLVEQFSQYSLTRQFVGHQLPKMVDGLHVVELRRISGQVSVDYIEVAHKKKELD